MSFNNKNKSLMACRTINNDCILLNYFKKCYPNINF